MWLFVVNFKESFLLFSFVGVCVSDCHVCLDDCGSLRRNQIP